MLHKSKINIYCNGVLPSVGQHILVKAYDITLVMKRMWTYFNLTCLLFIVLNF